MITEQDRKAGTYWICSKCGAEGGSDDQREWITLALWIGPREPRERNVWFRSLCPTCAPIVEGLPVNLAGFVENAKFLREAWTNGTLVDARSEAEKG
jgi:hypothetical protein